MSDRLNVCNFRIKNHCHTSYHNNNSQQYQPPADQGNIDHEDEGRKGLREDQDRFIGSLHPDCSESDNHC